MWTREGLEYFYTMEKHWKTVYTTKSIFSKFATEWEYWEPEDKTLRDTIRTHWLHDEEIYELEKNEPKKVVKRSNGGIKMEKMDTLLHTITLIGNGMTQ